MASWHFAECTKSIDAITRKDDEKSLPSASSMLEPTWIEQVEIERAPRFETSKAVICRSKLCPKAGNHTSTRTAPVLGEADTEQRAASPTRQKRNTTPNLALMIFIRRATFF
jgi:hypothetical protein